MKVSKVLTVAMAGDPVLALWAAFTLGEPPAAEATPTFPASIRRTVGAARAAGGRVLLDVTADFQCRWPLVEATTTCRLHFAGEVRSIEPSHRDGLSIDLDSLPPIELRRDAVLDPLVNAPWPCAGKPRADWKEEIGQELTGTRQRLALQWNSSRAEQ